MKKNNIEYAKKLISDFCFKEYDGSADFTDLKNVEIAYTDYEDLAKENGLSRLSVQSSVNLVNHSLKQSINEMLVEEIKYDSLESLIENELEHLDFDSLVFVEDDSIERYKTKTENKIKTIKNLYMILVWDKNRSDYVEWGVCHSSKEKAVNTFTNYMKGTAKMNNEYWNQEHIMYASRPFKVRESTITSSVEERIKEELKLDLQETKDLLIRLNKQKNKNREAR